MNFDDIKYSPEFEVSYKDQLIKISSTDYDGETLYRLYWPDDTIDFISANEIEGDRQCCFNTIQSKSKTKRLRTIILSKQN